MTEIRKRVRQRRRTSTVTEVPVQNPEGQDTEPSAKTESNGHSDNQTGESIEDARLDILQILILQGKTQKEIAAFFGVTDRTIRNWRQRLGNRPSMLLDQIDGKAELTQFLLRFAAREHELLCWMREAEAKGDEKLPLACNKQLRDLQYEKYRFLRDIGALTGIKLGSQTPENRLKPICWI